MKFPQKFLRGAFRSVIRFASQEANAASMARDERRQCRVEIVPLGPSDGVEGGGDSQEPSSRELRPVHAWGVGRSSCTTASFLRGGVGVQVSRTDSVGEGQSERRRW